MAQRIDMSRVAVVILCGGKGTRMGSRMVNKVCLPVGGEPAVNRTIRVLKECGARAFVIVVGALAGRVMETVGGSHPDVGYVFQDPPLGTGHAARKAVEFLRSLGHRDPVLVTMGDKVIDPEAVTGLAGVFPSARADLAFVVGPKWRWPGSGRIVLDGSGNVIGNVESKDLRAARKGGAKIQVGEHLLSAEEIEARSSSVNLSVYLFAASALYEAVEHLDSPNVQGEVYLTDAITYLANARDAAGANRFRVVPYPISDPELVMGFNTPDELRAVEEALSRRG